MFVVVQADFIDGLARKRGGTRAFLMEMGIFLDKILVMALTRKGLINA